MNNKFEISDSWNQKDDVSYWETVLWLSEAVIKKISEANWDEEWMLEMRLKAFEVFKSKEMQDWGPDLSELNLDEICYYAKAKWTTNAKTWDDVPDNIKNTFDKLGIPEAEKRVLAWVGAQYDSEWVYHSLKEELKSMWVIFEDISDAIKSPLYWEMVKKHFSKAVSMYDHKFAALHYAVWSGWTFLYVPSNIKIDEPLQSYFRMNVENGGQFEHTLIILENGANAHYIEWCSAPKYDSSSLHAWCVEIFVNEDATMRYSSAENWSTNTYNLNTKRALLQKNAHISWVWGNLWSKTTMLYPCSILIWDNSSSENFWISFAGKWQNQDLWSKVIHIWKNTSSTIISRSISKDGWISTYRWLVDIKSSAEWAISSIKCDWIISDDISINRAIPMMILWTDDCSVTHEATAGKIDKNTILYLESRWFSEDEAIEMVVMWFINPVIKELPLEYAAEMNVLISSEFDNK